MATKQKGSDYSSRVTVIIAVYNCNKFVQQCIDSILNQSFPNLEILVCDDGSTDGTWEVLLAFTDPRIRLFRNEVNVGVVDCRNKLLSIASGDFILIQDADDWATNNRVQTQLNTLLSLDLDVCLTSHFRVDISGRVGLPSSAKSSMVSLNNISILDFMPGTMMLRRSVYEKLGGYSDFFSRLISEDLYWICRMVSCFRVYYLEVPLYYYRLNPRSITSSLLQDRQLVVGNVMEELISQRITTGTDWIEQGDIQAVEQFIGMCCGNRVLMAEKYRVAAAIRRDCGDRWAAIQMIVAALIRNPFKLTSYRTLRYVIW